MKRLLNKTKLVKQILQEVPVTRQSDAYLLLEYYRRTHVDTEQSFKQLVLTNQLNDIMSVIRIRQRLQEHFPDLVHQETYDARHSKKPVFVDFATKVDKETLDNL